MCTINKQTKDNLVSFNVLDFCKTSKIDEYINIIVLPSGKIVRSFDEKTTISLLESIWTGLIENKGLNIKTSLPPKANRLLWLIRQTDCINVFYSRYVKTPHQYLTIHQIETLKSLSKHRLINFKASEFEEPNLSEREFEKNTMVKRFQAIESI